MDCRDARLELIECSDRSEAARRHVDGCAECRRYQADLDLIRDNLNAPVSTPPALRADTLARCQVLLRSRTATGETTSRWKPRRFMESPRVAVAAAVVGVLVLIIWMSLQMDGSGNDSADLSLKLTFFQLLAQNLCAALCLPALLWFRDRQAGVARPK